MLVHYYIGIDRCVGWSDWYVDTVSHLGCLSKRKISQRDMEWVLKHTALMLKLLSNDLRILWRLRATESTFNGTDSYMGLVQRQVEHHEHRNVYLVLIVVRQARHRRTQLVQQFA